MRCLFVALTACHKQSSHFGPLMADVRGIKITMSDNTNNQASGLAKFNLFLIIVIGVVVMIYESEQQRVIHNLVESMRSIDRLKQPIDFSVSDIQPLSAGFMLASAAQVKHLTGIRFTGRVINTQSVKYHKVTFNLAVAGKNKEFTINKISSGNSTSFSVYIPDLIAEDARFAKIDYVRSSISYQTK